MGDLSSPKWVISLGDCVGEKNHESSLQESVLVKWRSGASWRRDSIQPSKADETGMASTRAGIVMLWS